MPKLPPRAAYPTLARSSWAYPRNRPWAEALRCLNCAVCSECRQCVVACQPKAIRHDMRDEVVDIEIGTVVVATGFDPFNACQKPEFATAATPTSSRPPVRAAGFGLGADSRQDQINGKVPKRSSLSTVSAHRDKQLGVEYCSRICCMYTAKQAHLAHDKVPGSNITVFYMDVRAFGKGFEEFYDRVRAEGITYRRGNPSEIYRAASS